MLSGAFTVLELIQAIITATIGVVALSAALENYFLIPCNLPQRLILLVSSLGLITPGSITDMLGISGVILVYLWQKSMRAKERPGPATGV